MHGRQSTTVMISGGGGALVTQLAAGPVRQGRVNALKETCRQNFSKYTK